MIVIVRIPAARPDGVLQIAGELKALLSIKYINRNAGFLH